MTGELAPATRLITGGRPAATPGEPLNVPVTFASSYHADGPVGYARDGNPTWTAFEDVLGDLEGGTALAFASGLAASSAILSLLPEGGVVVAPRTAYHGALELLRELADAGRAEVRHVDVSDTAAVVEATRGADLVWLESPTNPLLDVADLGAITAAGRAAGALVVVDNTFATPLLQRPLELGADVVLHSATKLLSGHSDLVLGVLVARTVTTADDVIDRLRHRRAIHGGIPGPMEVYLALRGLRTLGVRLERAQANATELARRLGDHPAVELVRYPGFGMMCAAEVRGGAEAADRVVGAVRVWIHATSLGGVESSLERRRRWGAESPLVPESLLRLSVGIEDVDDLWADLSQALDHALG